MNYRNEPKLSDIQVWANSADPDQTAPRGGVCSGSSLFAIFLLLLERGLTAFVRVLE